MKQNEMLSAILLGNTELIKTYISVYERFDSDSIILITPQQIKKVLIDYLDNKISSQELQIWADFLCFNDALYTKNNNNEDYYESMWHVLQKISTPYLDGEITIDSISNYITELNDKYNT